MPNETLETRRKGGWEVTGMGPDPIGPCWPVEGLELLL